MLCGCGVGSACPAQGSPSLGGPRPARSTTGQPSPTSAGDPTDGPDRGDGTGSQCDESEGPGRGADECWDQPQGVGGTAGSSWTGSWDPQLASSSDSAGPARGADQHQRLAGPTDDTTPRAPPRAGLLPGVGRPFAVRAGGFPGETSLHWPSRSAGLDGAAPVAVSRKVGHHHVNKAFSLAEAPSWIQASDLQRRETLQVRTGHSGLRGGPDWLPGHHDWVTPRSAKGLTGGALAAIQ